MRILRTWSIVTLIVVTMHSNPDSANGQLPEPPEAKKIPHELTTHGHVRNDEYYWLKERENADVISYLNSENEYTREMMSDVADLEGQLYDEIISRIKQDDQSVPYEDRGYVYYTRYNEGQQYPIYCRRPVGEDQVEQVMLDVNEIAEGQPFCQVGGLAVSPDNRLLAYAVDFVGRRQYTIHVRDLETGKLLPDEIPAVNGSIEWANDNRTLFYTQNDPQTLRSYLVKRHRLGSPVEQDTVVFEETDEEFNCSIGQTRSRKYLIIFSNQTLSTEVRLLDLDQPEAEPVVFLAREPEHEYSVDHLDGRFLIRSNQDAPNFRLLSCDEQDTGRAAWQELIPHRDDTFLEDFDMFSDYTVLTERNNALNRLRIMANDGSEDYYLPFDESAYVAYTAPTPEPDTSRLRFGYTSLTTPRSTLEYDMKSRERTLLKQDPVLGDFDASSYRTERLWAEARDGTRIPVTVVYHKDTPIDGSAPCLEYGYGSYGFSMDPRFQVTLLPLLDRGFVFAIAHIRGGQEMGRPWYEDGKLKNKMNTFTDFVDVGRFLIEEGYADPDRLYARGGSAGGLLMGAVINLAPELYHGVIADVPFVDVVTTMLDDSIPLTTFEYDEWGNPNEEDYYRYMLSYSPYDNISERDYPNLLVTSGLHDSQVQYWEPTKWVARLRDHWQGDNLLLLKTNMEAGHGGASGRFDRFKETAFRYAFLLKLAQPGEN